MKLDSYSSLQHTKPHINRFMLLPEPRICSTNNLPEAFAALNIYFLGYFGSAEIYIDNHSSVEIEVIGTFVRQRRNLISNCHRS
mmetsp:Transcript_13777/g.15705  ORF Transcript_13777/g.15705 Transcript_13777/m.15705 type:complete len:84 (-) Transcript_13777:7-258(-)